MDGERCYADLPLDLLPGLLRLGRVADVKQCIIDPRERLSCIFIMAAWRENHVSENTGGKLCHTMDADKSLLDQAVIQMDPLKVNFKG